MSGRPSQMAVNRTWLQPRLVQLITGLRRHQVEEAVHLLLDYIDSNVAAAPPAVANDAGRLVAEVRRKVADYHFALDTRQHGGGASHALVSELESILATPWNPGLEATKRGPAS